MSPYRNHLNSSDDLVTTYEATRAGFVALALEKNRRATPYVAEARALQKAVSIAKAPADLPNIEGIETGLLTAAGISEKAFRFLLPQDKSDAIDKLIDNFLEPAGEKFVEELVYRFLLTRGDKLGGSMRNIGGALAQRKFTRAIIATLSIAGISYQWQHAKSRKWIDRTNDDAEIELSLRGLRWQNENGNRTLIYNLTVPIVENNVDFILFNLFPSEVEASKCKQTETYLVLGELKGGIDPAGADEHWKTARTALDRIRTAFSKVGRIPYTFFVGAAIENKMAAEIWADLEAGVLSNAANLTDENQVLSISQWLCSL
ncbi:MAG: type II restriction endonuclease [Anaerolineales bacterium]|nr:type II restriction endonuclease [Anaerolineales bacterium]